MVLQDPPARRHVPPNVRIGKIEFSQEQKRQKRADTDHPGDLRQRRMRDDWEKGT
jgi:hypothetical protein